MLEFRADRGDVDDRALAGDQAGQSGPGHPDGAEEVEREGLLPLGVAGVEEAGEGEPVGVAASHVVDQDVDPAELLHSGIDELAGAFPGAQVDGGCDRPGGLRQAV
nr:hypothetical protein [Thermomonospora umbrina]